jgi:hypothetical protein
MANSLHLFDDLILSNVGKVDRINDGLAILGKGTFKFCITDDDGRVHHIRIPNYLYLPKLHGACCCHNIGRRRWETMKLRLEILSIAASCIGMVARRQSPFTHRPTHQSSIQLPPQAHTGCLWPHSKRWRHLSFGGRQLSNCLDHGFQGSTSYPKNSWWKKTSIEARRNQLMRQTRMTTLFAPQTYLPPRLRRIHPASPSDEGPSPSIQIHQRPRRRTSPFPPLTTKPS